MCTIDFLQKIVYLFLDFISFTVTNFKGIFISLSKYILDQTERTADIAVIV